MITIKVPENELYDENKMEFVSIKETEITLEHSLVSISKWEAKWHKPFLSVEEKTKEEVVDYIKCMCITQNVNPMCFYALTNDNFIEINKYIEDPMSASTVNDTSVKKGVQEKLTSELIYYYMIALQIPFECQKWHLNRLLMLIKICSAKNTPSKKMGKNEILSRNKSLNEARRKALHSAG